MNSGLSDAPCNNFQCSLFLVRSVWYKSKQRQMFFNKKICGGLPSCKSRNCSILHLEARGYFWLCGNKAFSETMRWVRFFWTAPWSSLGDLQLVVKDWAVHGIQRTMTSYTKRCIRMRRVCWCKFGRNPTIGFCLICVLVSLSWIPSQSFFPYYWYWSV